MFSQTVEYALRAMIQLAYADGKGCSTDAMAKTTLVPRAYLSKVLQSLRKAGLVESRRGAGGGIALSRSPAEISILEVINAVDPIRRISTCPLGLKSHGKRLCPLHSKMDSAFEAIEDSCRGSTLQDIVLAPHNGSKPLCETGNDPKSL